MGNYLYKWHCLDRGFLFSPKHENQWLQEMGNVRELFVSSYRKTRSSSGTMAPWASLRILAFSAWAATAWWCGTRHAGGRHISGVCSHLLFSFLHSFIEEQLAYKLHILFFKLSFYFWLTHSNCTYLWGTVWCFSSRVWYVMIRSGLLAYPLT